MQTICASFDVPLLINIIDGGRTPVLPKRAYIDLGYQIAIYPGAGFLVAAEAMKSVYRTLGQFGSSVDVDVPLRDTKRAPN